jgi:hypothetical protein
MGFTDFNSYEKDTVILNSDRVILNSKDDSVFILSKKTVGMSAADSVHFDVGPRGTKDSKYIFIVNAPSIQLGLPANGINEPVAKADSVIAFITDLINSLNAFSTSLVTATGVGVGVTTFPQINAAADLLNKQLKSYKDKYTEPNSPIKSKVSKTI